MFPYFTVLFFVCDWLASGLATSVKYIVRLKLTSTQLAAAFNYCSPVYVECIYVDTLNMFEMSESQTETNKIYDENCDMLVLCDIKCAE